jgi:hypothetical protein
MIRFNATAYAGQVGYPVPEGLGFLPSFLSENDERSAAQQINENYAHGGGWSPLNGFVMRDDHSIVYPADADGPDEVYRPLAEAQLRDERLYFYDCEWLAIVQPDGSFEVSRMD